MDFLLLQLSFFIKRKYGIKLKLWKYRCQSQYVWFLAIMGLAYCLIYILYHWESSTIITLFLGGILSFVNAILRQLEDYSDADINNCQKDTESIGAFWAHQAFNAYYNIVLQNLNDRMASFEKEHDLKFFVNKLVIVIPLSCDVQDILTAQDQNIKYIDFLPCIECDQGGNINRQLKNPVYEISLDKTVYIAAEYPSSLNTLWKMQYELGKEKFIYHRDCFIKTLKFLLKGRPCIVIEYDDTQNRNSLEPLGNFLLSTLRKKDNVIFSVE